MTKRQDEILKEILALSTDHVQTGKLMTEYTNLLFDKVLGIVK